MHHDVIVAGAGIAGLALARELGAQGHAPVVLERARGVGGRCATRRVEGQPVDHGLPCLQGRSQRFLAELDALPDASALPGWPQVVVGDGLPCRPEAFGGTDRRLALGEGASRFGKHLAEGIDVRLGAEVTAQFPLLELVRILPCLAVIARYPAGVPAPEWQASFPGSSGAIHSILHDSSKRATPARLTLLLQARPEFSDMHLNESADFWTRTLLEEAATLHGAWVAQPELAHSHVWSKARVAAGSELSGPLVVDLNDGTLFGVAGDAFHDADGAGGAYLSAIALADRFTSMLSMPA